MTDNIYSTEFVQGLFNRMSSSYRRMNYITSFGFSLRWRAQFLHHLQPTTDNIEVLDLLTGMGETWNSIRRKFPNAKVSALDFSSEMMRFAHQKNEAQFSEQIVLLQQDVLHNELRSNHYDVVTCAFGLKTFSIEQLTVLAEEIQRILKKGGQFSFIEISKPRNRVLKNLYGFYLGKIIPVLGKLLLGNPREYRMLWHYTDKFVNAKTASEIFNATGLHTTYYSYFNGCATGFSGYK